LVLLIFTCTYSIVTLRNFFWSYSQPYKSIIPIGLTCNLKICPVPPAARRHHDIVLAYLSIYYILKAICGSSNYNDSKKGNGEGAFEDTPMIPFEPSDNPNYDDPEKHNGAAKTGLLLSVVLSMGSRQCRLLASGVQSENVGLARYVRSPNIL
jgi:hypothetical protein